METKPHRRRREVFVKYHLGLSYLLSPAESRFLMHMVDFDHMKRCGYKTDFTRAQYMKRMGLREYTFDTAAKSLVELGLIDRSADSSRNRVFYDLNTETYERLITIISSIQNYEKLSTFLSFNIKKLGRSIDSITDEELDNLCQ